MIDNLNIGDNNVVISLSEFTQKLETTGNFLSCYLTGSHCGGYAVENASDIDLTLVSNGDLSSEAQTELDQIIIEMNEKYSIDLDISVISQKAPTDILCLGISFREAAMSAKIAGKLIWGQDSLEKLPTLSREEYVASTARIPFEFSNRIRGYQGLQFPLTYPNADDKYFGYTLKGDDGVSTKPLISLLTWIGTATVANLSGRQIGNKHQCVTALKECDFKMGQELSRIFDQCRARWKYQEPNSFFEQKALSGICKTALTWEQTYYDRFFPDETGPKRENVLG